MGHEFTTGEHDRIVFELEALREAHMANGRSKVGLDLKTWASLIGMASTLAVGAWFVASSFFIPRAEAQQEHRIVGEAVLQLNNTTESNSRAIEQVRRMAQSADEQAGKNDKALGILEERVKRYRRENRR
jgi:hypothetical protein